LLIEKYLGKRAFSIPIVNLAQKYSKIIEAFCWNPKSRIDEESYRLMSSSKTNEVCQALLEQYLGCSHLQGNVDQIMNQQFDPFPKIFISDSCSVISPNNSPKVRLPPLSALLSV
jgi:hypothetical protein